MDDRDTFAAAALTGLIANGDYSVESTPLLAYRMADAMLAVRDSRTADTKNHDAAPAAKATADRYVRRAAADGGSDRTDKAATRPSEGTGDTPPPHTTPPQCSVPGDGSVSDSRTENEPVAWAALYKNGALAWANATREAAMMGVSSADHDRVVPLYRHPSRNGVLSGCETVPDPDSRVWETPRTPQTHHTPPQGSVPGECSFRDSRNANEPVAWWLKGTEYDTGCEYEYVSLAQESADAAAKEGGTVTPLYRAPTLTDEEREAVEVFAALAWTSLRWGKVERHAATLRKLLERTK